MTITVLVCITAVPVGGCVMVVTTVAAGKNVVAIFTADVGHRGVTFVAVIAFGGLGCIGAYLVSPFCWSYGIDQSPPAGAAGAGAAGAGTPGAGAAGAGTAGTGTAGAAGATLGRKLEVSVCGPVVSETVDKAALMVSGNSPVNELTVNLLE